MDAERMVELSGQLGYPATAKQMKTRLSDVSKEKARACWESRAMAGDRVIHVIMTSCWKWSGGRSEWAGG
jgi:hypothetical protein